MKKTTFIGVFAVMLVLAFFGCDNGNNNNGHTHTWAWTASTVWGMENGACNGCTETRLRLSPDMKAQIPAGNIALSSTFTVTLSTFKIGKYQITQAQNEAVTGNNPSYFDGSIGGSLYEKDTPTGEIQEKRPVEQVTWYDAVEFCNKLSVLEGLTPVYTITGRTPKNGYPITAAAVTADFTKNGYHLPTEAQWEYACRAGSTGYYSIDILGNEVTSSNLGEYAWSYTNSDSKTHEVGKKTANAFGLYDMHGNVWEWCWDLYGTYPSEPKTDYTGTVVGSDRAVRGGGWGDSAEYGVFSARGSYYPGGWNRGLGFRLVCP